MRRLLDEQFLQSKRQSTWSHAMAAAVALHRNEGATDENNSVVNRRKPTS
jgi:hypothetical protein